MDSNLLNKQYSVLVAGNVDLTKYDITVQVPPYVVYEYDKRAEIRQKAIDIYSELIENTEKQDGMSLISQLMKFKLQEMEEMTDEEYFEEATRGMTYDKNTGNALTTFNPNGKYVKINDATIETAIPLIGNNFQCFVQDLPDKNVNDEVVEKYSKHWDTIMCDSKHIKDNYINTYQDKDTYIKVMTEPLFYNAFVSEETGWLEQSDENQVQWVLNFRDRFIKNLPKNTILKVYNFNR